MTNEEKLLLFNKLDKIGDDITGMKIVAVMQESNLKAHMKRSDSLEIHVSLLEEQFVKIQSRFLKMDGAVKLVGFLGLLAGIWKATH